MVFEFGEVFVLPFKFCQGGLEFAIFTSLSSWKIQLSYSLLVRRGTQWRIGKKYSHQGVVITGRAARSCFDSSLHYYFFLLQNSFSITQTEYI
jgi:hypothetical protein